MPNTEDAQTVGGMRTNMGPAVSDPTPLTTQQLLRENFWLRELSEAKLDNVVGRIQAMDIAVKLLQDFAARTPTTMDVQSLVERLREVTFEKFGGVDAQFAQNDKALTAALQAQEKQAIATTESSSKAITAALQAQEKQAIATNQSSTAAISKMEDGFTKQIDGLANQLQSMVKGVDDKINDIKERITIIESKTSISDPSSAIAIAELKASVHRLSSVTDISSGRGAGMTGLWGLIIGGIGAAFGIASIVAIAARMMK